MKQPVDCIPPINEQLLKAALAHPCRHITDVKAPFAYADKQDFCSEGDYWWPNPKTPNGLPYLRRDGESNPFAFAAHRLLLRAMRTDVALLAQAYQIYAVPAYAEKACRILREFFVDENTRMHPHLQYAQGVRGVCEGRGIGIIDTLHLVDIPFAVEALRSSAYMDDGLYLALRAWFSAYMMWLQTSPNGIAEQNEENNHSVAYFVQLAAFARFTRDETVLAICQNQFCELLCRQMREYGAFPRELARTKPYAYSIFTLDLFATLCQIASTEQNNLWQYTSDTKSLRAGFAFLLPYLQCKSTWPFAHDIECFDAWPVQMPSLLFAHAAYGDDAFLHTYQNLPPLPENSEVRRNIAVRSAYLLML